MYRPPAWTIAASVLLFGRLLTDQAGAAASEQLTFRADVNLVQVDVGVFAPDGQPVRGLTAGDFKIFDRNRPRPVETFAEITNTPATDVGASLKLPRATWLTFLRTFSTWSHVKGVPGKVIAQLMGHANVDTTLTSTPRSGANCSQLSRFGGGSANERSE
jgi:hypothetical protein